ncbi:MAG: SPOR domain-containing protein [Bacteroidia bacterium]
MNKFYYAMFCLLLCFSCGKDEGKEKNIRTETIGDSTAVTKVSNEKGARKLQLGKTNGFRVQLYASLVREDALKYKAVFQKHFPEIENYIVYDEPRYKLRAGDFLDKENARIVCNRINSVKELDGSFVIKCKVNVILEPATTTTGTTSGGFDIKPVPVDTSKNVIWVDSTGSQVKFSTEEVLTKEEAKQERRVLDNEFKSEPLPTDVPAKPGDLLKPAPRKLPVLDSTKK